MKKCIKSLVVLALPLILIGATAEKNKASESETPAVPPTRIATRTASRSFHMGFVPIPAQPLSTENWLAAFDLFKKSSEVVMHHVHFSADALPGAEFICQMADRHGLKKFLMLDPLSNDRQDLDPDLKVLGGNFAEAGVRQAFKNRAVTLATTYRPMYLGLGSEINTYLAKSSSELSNYLTLLSETVAAVKQASPQTIVTLSVQYEELSGATGQAAQWEMLRQLATQVEAVAFTTYPSAFFASPDQLPANYYLRIRKFTNKPLLIAESGWPTSGSASASIANQIAFLGRIPELTKDLNLRLWIWWFPHDWAGGGYPEIFSTMGLRESSGTPKASWASWLKINSRPIK